MPRDIDTAIRDCAAVLAIFADRWRNAEHYRDCLELLARAVPRCVGAGKVLEREAREELMVLTRNVEDMGIHRHVSRMLHEICAGGDAERMQL